MLSLVVALALAQNTATMAGHAPLPASSSPPFLTAFVTVPFASECQSPLTTVQGGAITSTRGSDKWCQRSDGFMIDMSENDAPALETDGLLIESASSNQVPWSYDLTTNGSGTPSNATLTGGQTAPDTSIQADQCVSTSNGGYCPTDTFTISSASGVASVFVQAASGTRAYAIRLWDVTAGAAACTVTGTATTTWTLQKARPYCTSSSLTSGHTFEMRIYPGGTGSTGTLRFWGLQAEPGRTQPSSYIQTDGVATTRAADVVSVSISGHNINTAGCMAADATFIVAEDSAHLFTLSGEVAITNHIRPYINDGTTVIFGPVAELNALTTTITGTWGGATEKIYSGSSVASGSFDGSFGSGSTVYVGSNSGVLQFLNGWMKNIKIGATATSCGP